jgi:hypothetical protein
MNCQHCKSELRSDGVQYDPLSESAWTLGTCTNEECPAFRSTFMMDKRKMTSSEMDRYVEFLRKLSRGVYNEV